MCKTVCGVLAVLEEISFKKQTISFICYINPVYLFTYKVKLC